MPIQNYSLLRGRVKDALPYEAGADHYQILVQGAGNLYRIAVDVYSQLKGSKRRYSPEGATTWDVDREVMFYKDENFSHDFLSDLLNSKEGLTAADDLPESLHLDYVRYTPALFPLDKMKTVPPKDESGTGGDAGEAGASGDTGDGRGGDLNDDIDPWIQKARINDDAEVFAFGSSWDDAQSGHADPTVYFHPNPSLGIHDIHMNQGDSGSEAKYNGIWQDGALLIHFGKDSGNFWVAMFFRFVNQTTDTDRKGDPE